MPFRLYLWWARGRLPSGERLKAFSNRQLKKECQHSHREKLNREVQPVGFNLAQGGDCNYLVAHRADQRSASLGMPSCSGGDKLAWAGLQALRRSVAEGIPKPVEVTLVAPFRKKAGSAGPATRKAVALMMDCREDHTHANRDANQRQRHEDSQKNRVSVRKAGVTGGELEGRRHHRGQQGYAEGRFGIEEADGALCTSATTL